MIRVFDPVIMRKGNIKDRKENSNPILEKYYILTRTNDDNIAKGLNINAETHKEIIEIIEHPDFTALTKKEESLLWKYRYPIKADKQYRKAVVKFLRSVDWTKEKEENEAIEMLQDWEFDIEQAIPMLSVLFSANDLYPSEIQSKRCVDIRKCAIQVLNREDTETLLRIMLQLTQAYRYEKFSEKLLLEFFLSKVTKNHSISHTFYWSIKLEKDNKENDLNIRIEYEFLFNSFMDKLREDDPENLSLLERQWEFRNKLYDLSSYVKEGNKIKHKKHRLKEAINEGGKFDMTNFEPTPMPLDPSIFVCGLETEKCTVFPSAMCPLKLTFKVTEETKISKNQRVNDCYYSIMYKQGDDVRQDQLVLQMIDLMDFILKQINLDFKFTAYKVLAHSESDGMLEFVPNCQTIQAILQKYK